MKARVNSDYCRAIEDLPICDALDERPVGGAFPRAVRGVQFAVPLKQMNHGYNVVELMQAHESDTQEVVWVEIRIDLENER